MSRARDSSRAELELVDAMCDLEHPVKSDATAWATTHLGVRDSRIADSGSDFDEDGWHACADRGVLGMLVPAMLGGSEASLAETLLTLEGLGAGTNEQGLLYAIASQICSTQTALLAFGSDEQKHRWLPVLCSGGAIGAFAMTEPEHGSDTEGIEATAVQADGGYVVSGRKAYITLAPRADMVIVFASTDPGAGRWGISAFLVPTDTPGVSVTPNREKMGLRTTPFGDITLENVRVPQDALLGREGSGMSIFLDAMVWERSFVFAPQIGAMERQIDAGVQFARSRTVGGHPIGDHQAVSHRIADMKLRHETARTLLYKSALLIARHEPTALSAALSKLAASEGAAESALASVHLYGAKGYVSEFEIERDVRDALGGLVYSGTSDIQRNIVARLLGATRD